MEDLKHEIQKASGNHRQDFSNYKAISNKSQQMGPQLIKGFFRKGYAVEKLDCHQNGRESLPAIPHTVTDIENIQRIKIISTKRQNCCSTVT